MIQPVPDHITAPTVDDLTAGRGGSVHLRRDRPHEHPIAWESSIGLLAFRLLGDGYVWICTLTGNGGAVDTYHEALDALLAEALTEFPTTNERPHP